MNDQSMGAAVKDMLGGHALLVLCIICYLIWWCITFKPGGGSTPFGNTCIVLAFVSGAAGVFLNSHGISLRDNASAGVPGAYILIGGAIAYAALFLIFTLVFHRQLTTELFLIVGWAVLELCTLNALFCTGNFTSAVAIGLAVIVIAAAAASLVCYMLYYGLEGRKGWIDGMIPLITAGAVMALIMVMTYIRR